MKNEKFQKLVFWCQKVLPLVYDNSLSYYEVLCKIADSINYIIDYLNDIDLDGYATITYVNQQAKTAREYTETVGAWNKQYTDKQINLLRTACENYTDAEIRKTNKKISELDTKLIGKINDLRKEVNARITFFEESVNSEIYVFKLQIQQKMEKFMQEILEIVQNYPEPEECFNPTNGLMEPICKCLNDIYHWLRYGAFDCNTFDTSGITAGEFDAKEPTCREFDTSGMYIFNMYKCTCTILNPFSGLQTSVEDAFRDAIAAFGNGVTVDIFEELELTCAEFESKELTASQFDFTNKILN